MSVIYGNIRYFAYYSSLEDLRQDTNVREGYLVSVISSGNIDVDYVISSTPGDSAVAISNGLYANPIFTGNSLSSGVSQVYSSVRPSDYEVGGVKKGDVFSSVSVTDVFNKIFNGTEMIVATMIDGASESILYRRSELLQINGITLWIESTYYPVVRVDVIFNGEVVATQDCDVTAGQIQIPCSISLRDTGTITVQIYDSNENSIQKSMTHHFVDPVFWGLASPGMHPSPTLFDSSERHMGFDDLEFTRSFSRQIFWIAVPSDTEDLNHIYDENNLISDGLWDEIYSIPYTTSDYSCMYKFYVSSSLTVSDYTFRSEFKEVTA